MLPSDISRLVLAYLHEECLETTYDAFLMESPHLEELRQNPNSGILRPSSKGLVAILEEYEDIKDTEKRRYVPDRVLHGLWRKFDSVVGQLKYKYQPSNNESNPGIQSMRSKQNLIALRDQQPRNSPSTMRKVHGQLVLPTSTVTVVTTGGQRLQGTVMRPLSNTVSRVPVMTTTPVSYPAGSAQSIPLKTSPGSRPGMTSVESITDSNYVVDSVDVRQHMMSNQPIGHTRYDNNTETNGRQRRDSTASVQSSVSTSDVVECLQVTPMKQRLGQITGLNSGSFKSPKRKSVAPRRKTSKKPLDPQKKPDPPPLDAEMEEALKDLPQVLETLLSNRELQQKLAGNINRALPLEARRPDPAVPASPQDPSVGLSLSIDDILNTQVAEATVNEIVSMTSTDPAFEALFSLFNVDKEQFVEEHRAEMERQSFESGSSSTSHPMDLPSSDPMEIDISTSPGRNEYNKTSTPAPSMVIYGKAPTDNNVTSPNTRRSNEAATALLHNALPSSSGILGQISTVLDINEDSQIPMDPVVLPSLDGSDPQIMSPIAVTAASPRSKTNDGVPSRVQNLTVSSRAPCTIPPKKRSYDASASSMSTALPVSYNSVFAVPIASNDHRSIKDVSVDGRTPMIPSESPILGIRQPDLVSPSIDVAQAKRELFSPPPKPSPVKSKEKKTTPPSDPAPQTRRTSGRITRSPKRFSPSSSPQKGRNTASPAKPSSVTSGMSENHTPKKSSGFKTPQKVHDFDENRHKSQVSPISSSSHDGQEKLSTVTSTLKESLLPKDKPITETAMDTEDARTYEQPVRTDYVAADTSGTSHNDDINTICTSKSPMPKSIQLSARTKPQNKHKSDQNQTVSSLHQGISTRIQQTVDMTRQVENTNKSAEETTIDMTRQVENTNTSAEETTIDMTRQVENTSKSAEETTVDMTRQVENTNKSAVETTIDMTRRVENTNKSAEETTIDMTRQVENTNKSAVETTIDMTRQVENTSKSAEETTVDITRQVENTNTSAEETMSDSNLSDDPHDEMDSQPDTPQMHIVSQPSTPQRALMSPTHPQTPLGAQLTSPTHPHPPQVAQIVEVVSDDVKKVIVDESERTVEIEFEIAADDAIQDSTSNVTGGKQDTLVSLKTAAGHLDSLQQPESTESEPLVSSDHIGQTEGGAEQSVANKTPGMMSSHTEPLIANASSPLVTEREVGCASAKQTIADDTSEPSQVVYSSPERTISSNTEQTTAGDDTSTRHVTASQSLSNTSLISNGSECTHDTKQKETDTSDCGIEKMDQTDKDSSKQISLQHDMEHPIRKDYQSQDAQVVTVPCFISGGMVPTAVLQAPVLLPHVQTPTKEQTPSIISDEVRNSIGPMQILLKSPIVTGHIMVNSPSNVIKKPLQTIDSSVIGIPMGNVIPGRRLRPILPDSRRPILPVSIRPLLPNSMLQRCRSVTVVSPAVPGAPVSVFPTDSHSSPVTTRTIVQKSEETNSVLVKETHRTLSPRVTMHSPMVDIPSPKVDIPTPKIDAKLPGVDTPSPSINTTTPKVDAPTPKVNNITPKVDTPISQVVTPSPKIKSLTPKVNIPTPRLDTPTNKIVPPASRVDTPSGGILGQAMLSVGIPCHKSGSSNSAKASKTRPPLRRFVQTSTPQSLGKKGMVVRSLDVGSGKKSIPRIILPHGGSKGAKGAYVVRTLDCLDTSSNSPTNKATPKGPTTFTGFLAELDKRRSVTKKTPPQSSSATKQVTPRKRTPRKQGLRAVGRDIGSEVDLAAEVLASCSPKKTPIKQIMRVLTDDSSEISRAAETLISLSNSPPSRFTAIQKASILRNLMNSPRRNLMADHEKANYSSSGKEHNATQGQAQDNVPKRGRPPLKHQAIKSDKDQISGINKTPSYRSGENKTKASASGENITMPASGESKTPTCTSGESNTKTCESGEKTLQIMGVNKTPSHRLGENKTQSQASGGSNTTVQSSRQKQTVNGDTNSNSHVKHRTLSDNGQEKQSTGDSGQMNTRKRSRDEMSADKPKAKKPKKGGKGTRRRSFPTNMDVDKFLSTFVQYKQ